MTAITAANIIYTTFDAMLVIDDLSDIILQFEYKTRFCLLHTFLPVINITHVKRNILYGIIKESKEFVSCYSFYLSNRVYIEIFFPITVCIPTDKAYTFRAQRVWSEHDFEESFWYRDFICTNPFMFLTFKENWTTDDIDTSIFLCPFSTCNLNFFPIPPIQIWILRTHI